jgi:hypothetical protein
MQPVTHTHRFLRRRAANRQFHAVPAGTNPKSRRIDRGRTVQTLLVVAQLINLQEAVGSIISNFFGFVPHNCLLTDIEFKCVLKPSRFFPC